MATKLANGDIRKGAQTPVVEQRREAVTSLTGMYLLVVVIVAAAWGLGCCEFSFLWVFFMLGSLFVVWKTQIKRIITKQLNYEEATLHRKRALRQSETVEWLNFLLNRWWVFSSSTIEDLVKKRLDERLLVIKPSFLESLVLTTFNVGEQTPHVRNVRIFEFAEGVPGGHKPCTWFNINNPPVGLHNMSTYQIVLESDITMQCEDFKMIFRGRVGNKSVNVGFDMVVQDLNISGTLQAIVQLSMEVPFPHISKATVCFVEKPDVMFNINLLRAIQMMEVPLLKTWIHTNVMEGLTKALVDPASVDVHFAKIGPIQISRGKQQKQSAQGVLTIQVKGTPVKSTATDDIRYTVLKIGDRKRETIETPVTEEWEDVCSFFVYSLATEKLQVKNKCKRLLTSTVLEKNTFNLSSFPFQVRSFAEKEIENKDGSKTTLKMQYSALPPVNLEDYDASTKQPKVAEVAGVVYACIHGAANVLVADKTGASDPYCVLFCDRRRVLTTPYIPHTRNPRWESWVEFFVADFTKTSLSFFVFDWDGTNVIDDDFLGSAHLSLNLDETQVIKKTLTLGYNKPSEGYVQDKSCGQITVSVVFRPIPSVAKSERFRAISESIGGNEYLYREDMVSPASVSTAYLRLPKENDNQATRKSTGASYVDDYLQGKTIVELTILQGKDMVPMDRNGYSDPFCMLILNGKKIFTTAVKKKTLFPKWNETVTVEMPGDDALLSVDVYDKDIMGKDFMGKVPLSVENLKQLSVKGAPDWFQLQRTKSGKIQLKCTVLNSDTGKDGGNTSPAPPSDVFESPPESPTRVIPTMVVDDSYLNSAHLPDGTVKASTPLSQKRMSLGAQRPLSNELRRSVSDVNVSRNERRAATQNFVNQRRDSLGVPRRSTPGLRPSESINSVAVVQKTGDDISLASNMSADKLFTVVGKVMQARGLDREGEFYCKVRLEHHGSRISLFSTTRVLAKSVLIKASQPDINLFFEIDRGHGISPNAEIIVDLKKSSKEHLGTKHYALKDLLEDADESGILKWLPLENGIEIELSLSTGKPSPHHHRRSGRFLKSLSFRKEKHQ